MFGKGKLAMILNPLGKLLRESNFNINLFNRKGFNISRNKYDFRLKFAVFTISTSIAFITRYYFLNSNKMLNIKQISSDEIESLSLISENMIVIDQIKGTNTNKGDFIKRLIKEIKSGGLSKLEIKIYCVKDRVSHKNLPKATLYKGYGSLVSNIDLNFKSRDTIENIKTFFAPKSENVLNSHSSFVKNISHNTFVNEVINVSSENNPLLLMYYDDYCLMCFLVRPLINSLALKLINSSKIQFARYNIGRNELHELSPPVKATPTFVLFRGRQEPENWDEYKPRDLISKITEIIYGIKSNICDSSELAEFENIEQSFFLRFQLFTLLNLWNLYINELQDMLVDKKNLQMSETYLNHIEDLLSISTSLLEARASSLESKNCNGINLEKVISCKVTENFKFQEIFFENIKKDMERTDTLEENINHLLDEIKGYCNDYIAIKSLIKNN